MKIILVRFARLECTENMAYFWNQRPESGKNPVSSIIIIHSFTYFLFINLSWFHEWSFHMKFIIETILVFG